MTGMELRQNRQLSELGRCLPRGQWLPLWQWVLLVCLIAAGPAPLRLHAEQQTPAANPEASSQSASGSSSSSSSGSAKKKPSQQPPPSPKNTADENPFPADTSQKAAQQENAASPDAPGSAAPNPQQPAQKPGAAAAENPFPEDVSKGAAAAAKANDSGSPGATDSSGSSSSSSSSSNSPGGVDPDAGEDIPHDTGRRRLKKPSDGDIQSGSLAGTGRAKEDVKIGSYYLGQGDYKGAYARFQEAGQMDPANLEAIYGLAASADGMHRTQEALENYNLYLQIAPDGQRAKAAEKAIRALAK